MKKIILAFLITATVFLTLTFSLGALSMKKGDEFQVAMVTDFNDVNDNSFNQACYEGGKEWTIESKNHLLELCNRPQIKGLSILGGEPLSDYNLNELKDLFTEFRKRFPDKTIWMWTGHVYENLTPEQKEVANMVDVLIDGPWIMKLGDFHLKYKGSSNQRVIDIKKTKESGSVELYQES